MRILPCVHDDFLRPTNSSMEDIPPVNLLIAKILFAGKMLQRNALLACVACHEIQMAALFQRCEDVEYIWHHQKVFVA